jgi:hypothetical protein
MKSLTFFSFKICPIYLFSGAYIARYFVLKIFTIVVYTFGNIKIFFKFFYSFEIWISGCLKNRALGSPGPNSIFRIDRCFISGAYYSICSTSIYLWRIWKYAPLIISLLMAHVGQNAPLKSMWDPPEGSSTKYLVLSMAHLLYAPRIFYLLVAHIRIYAPLITCGPHLGPTGMNSARDMCGAYTNMHHW